MRLTGSRKEPPSGRGARAGNGIILASTFRALASLAVPDARQLWMAGVAVGVMRWLELLAFSLWALQVTGSPLVVASTTLLRMLPLLLLSVPLSALIEGRDKRRVLLVNLAFVAGLCLVMLAVSLAGAMSVPLLLLASFLGGVFWAVEQPVRRTLLAERVGLERAGVSMSFEGASNQLTRALGAVAGGLAAQLVGLAGVFLAGLLLYGTALLLVAATAPDGGGTGRTGRLASSAGLLDGLRHVARSRLLLGAALVTVIFNLWAFPYVALAPVVAERVLELSPLGIGTVLAFEGLGGFLACMSIASGARPEHFRRLYSLGPVVLMAATLLFACTASVPLACLLLFLGGFGMGSFSAMQMVIPLQAAPPAIRMRVVGVISMSIGTSPLGFFHAGLMGEILGAAGAMVVIGLEGLLATALLLWLLPELVALRAPAADRGPH
ncbi:MFS transporter [Marinimicrococcus flavescens]|uniref:MFS transporter n=1 Tax=Marinimicrococcus flavescens TaxID=3031815 RepID=A0AAP4D5Q5_9PROT|nr:MFS transporter [Marinimicrococcus flavescens]